jgi:cardiolipin synthase A/B
VQSFWGNPVVYLTLPLAGIVVLLLISIWSIRRHRNPKLNIACNTPIEQMIPSLAGLTLGTALEGNSVEILENADFYDVLEQEIRAAKFTVHFETFLWEKGALAQRIADALAEAARAGRKVRVLLDAIGASKVGREIRKQMEESGCDVVFFHRKGFHNLGVLNDRDHRKLAIMDGRVAFVGGHCIKDAWFGSPEDGEHYGDLSVRLHGPIVRCIQSAFAENWIAETGSLFVGEEVFPPLEPAGDALIHAAFVKPEGSAPAVKILHHAAICLARKRIWIQNPYFIPEPETIEAFKDAVCRGVDVRVILPSTEASDNPLVQHASHRNFEKLLKSGVRLFEYSETLLHQKVMTIDGVWSALGSSNFDDRSFETNDEITLGIFHLATAQQLDAIFERYARKCREINLEQWRRRSPWHKLVDNACYLLNEVL